jgi:hypothetical protein
LAVSAANPNTRWPAQWKPYATRALAIVATASLLVWLAWQLLPSDTPADAPPSATRSPLGEGSPAALPFGKGNAMAVTDRNPATMDVAALRDAYAAVEDRHEFHARLLARTEPEAKYFAWRAAFDCGVALRSVQDGAELQQVVADAIGRTGGDAEHARQRLLAATDLKRQCGGFLHPGAVPHAEMHRLLTEAAAAGHPAAQAALRTPGMDLVALVTRAVQSGDAMAFAEAAPALARLAYTHRIAGVEAGPQNVAAVQAGIEIAACRVAGTCAAGSLRLVAECVHAGVCEAKSLDAHLLSLPALGGANGALARTVAADAEAAFRRKDVAALLAPRR